ncbi:MAG: FKBP-type peptidyl-prolyl cis-trans isomerase [Mucilaginibacter polytrichastri]|nr:FKBP-type peptidyl-prolyl cis-trans isomerase [Mucilaginibacter polytrichastri]
MKKLFVLLALTAVFASCKKDKNDNQTGVSVEEQARIDDQLLQTYFTDKGLSPAKDETTGLYYQIVTPGTGKTPTANSVVEVRYVGTFLDGTVFDRTTNSNFSAALNSLIKAWQIGIPKIKEGGRINLYVPSGLGYGPNGAYNRNGQQVIPSNANILFTVDLVKVSQ